MAAPFIAWALFDTTLVAAILWKEYQAHKQHTKEQRSDLFGKLLELTQTEKLDVKVDPSAANQPYYKVANALISGELPPDKIGMINPDAEVPIVFTSNHNQYSTDIRLTLTIKELQMVVAAAHNMIGHDVAGMVAFMDKHPVDITLKHANKEAAANAASIVMKQPGERVTEAALQGKAIAANDNRQPGEDSVVR